MKNLTKSWNKNENNKRKYKDVEARAAWAVRIMFKLFKSVRIMSKSLKMSNFV